MSAVVRYGAGVTSGVEQQTTFLLCNPLCSIQSHYYFAFLHCDKIYNNMFWMNAVFTFVLDFLLHFGYLLSVGKLLVS